MEPPPLDIPGIGRVPYSPIEEGYMVRLNINFKGNPVELLIRPDTQEVNTKALEMAELILGDPLKLDAEVREMVGWRMLEIKNGVWLKPGESPLTQADFVSRLQLESIEIQEEGSVNFYYADGGLFWDHVVIAEIGSDRRFRDAYLYG